MLAGLDEDGVTRCKFSTCIFIMCWADVLYELVHYVYIVILRGLWNVLVRQSICVLALRQRARGRCTLPLALCVQCMLGYIPAPRGPEQDQRPYGMN